jgi:hypothetical protein
MPKSSKRRASALVYVSQSQQVLPGFETPFSKQLDPGNRWVELAHKIAWDQICNIYAKQVGVSHTGRPPISPRVVIGALIIKHICHLDDRETVAQISENMYMQYFLGYSAFNPAPPFDASLFVEFRTRIGLEQINAINEKVIALAREANARNPRPAEQKPHQDGKAEPAASVGQTGKASVEQGLAPGPVEQPAGEPENKGRLLLDATCCPQDIAYPTDLGLLSEAREKTEELIDYLFHPGLHGKKKPRTYRKTARKEFLRVAQKRTKSHPVLRRGIGKQINYLARNLRSIDKLLDGYATFPLDARQQKYLLVVRTLLHQQQAMHKAGTHSAEHRIVSIHQPHVRPIVRGKARAKTEFGAKIHVSLVEGYAFLDELSWDAFNEGSHLMAYVEQYRSRFGCYPAQVLADQIYCSRENRRQLKEKGIMLSAKPLGRPSAVNKSHVRPGERNPIEGKFGQAKTAYGLNKIKARLKDTSQSWIACIFLVLNLVKLAGQAPLRFILREIRLGFSARVDLVVVQLWRAGFKPPNNAWQKDC